jgi:hypothetical protein
MVKRDISIGWRFLGVSTRTNGRTRLNFLNDPATGRDRRAVAVAKKAIAKARAWRVTDGD